MSNRHLLLEQTLAVAQRLLLEQWRQRRGLIFWAVFPATMMLLFGLVYAHNISMRAGLDAAAAGILMGAALFFSCLGGTVAVIAAERERGTLRRLLASPLHPAAYFLGVVLAQLLLAAVQVFMLYSIAWYIGARYHGSLFLGGLILLLSVFSYVGMGFFLVHGLLGAAKKWWLPCRRLVFLCWCWAALFPARNHAPGYAKLGTTQPHAAHEPGLQGCCRVWSGRR